MSSALAPAKINVALLVGPLREDGKHEVVTLLERLELADRVTLAPAAATAVDGFPDDTIVAAALDELARRSGHGGGWRVQLDKRIPVAAGLAGGSSDAAAALLLANATLPHPHPRGDLLALGAAIGADVPFFLTHGPQLGEGDGTLLSGISLPRAYSVLLVLPRDEAKESTGAVYAAFDARDGASGFESRVTALRSLLPELRRPEDLALLPPNDLAASPLADEVQRLGAFRADVSGAGPTVYGLFRSRADAERAAASLEPLGRVWVTAPVREHGTGPAAAPAGAGRTHGRATP